MLSFEGVEFPPRLAAALIVSIGGIASIPRAFGGKSLIDSFERTSKIIYALIGLAALYFVFGSCVNYFGESTQPNFITNRTITIVAVVLLMIVGSAGLIEMAIPQVEQSPIRLA